MKKKLNSIIIRDKDWRLFNVHFPLQDSTGRLQD